MDDVTRRAPQVEEVAGLWRRLFAFVLDGLILGAFGACIGLIAYDQLVALGSWGRAVGGAIALIYFGALDSKLAGGQTLGKRIAQIKVVTVAGTPLSVGASTLRATIFCVPYFMNGTFIAAGAFMEWLLVFVVFGVGLAIGYLLLFNRRTGQSLHDLAVGAYVVSGRLNGPMDQTGRIWPAHFGVVCLILAAGGLFPFLVPELEKTGPFPTLLSVQQGLQQEPDVRAATASMEVSRFTGERRAARTKHVFSSHIFLSMRVTDLDSLANRCARIILDRDPSVDEEDEISISVIYGYDIGIASTESTRNFTFSPDQWRKRLSGGHS